MNIQFSDLESAIQHGRWVNQRIGLANASDVKTWMMNLSSEAFAEFTGRVESMARGCAFLQNILDQQVVKVS